MTDTWLQAFLNTPWWKVGLCYVVIRLLGDRWEKRRKGKP